MLQLLAISLLSFGFSFVTFLINELTREQRNFREDEIGNIKKSQLDWKSAKNRLNNSTSTNVRPPIFISADCWLKVFELLPPRQLGLGIALISHRFNYYVDEHFKTRKWALKFIQIGCKIGENGTKQMKIADFYLKQLPIPQIQLPRKVTGFKRIAISRQPFPFIDQNAIAFLHRFRQLFAVCPIHLAINTTSDRILEFIFRNIWPMIAKNICGMYFSADVFHRLRQFVPSILNEFPSLHFVSTNFDDLFTEFPADESAAASDEQAVAKWLFTPSPDNVPKVFKCELDKDDGNWPSKVAAFKAAFASASSPANFIVVIWFQRSSFAHSVMPFDQTNELTREQLAFKRTCNSRLFLLVRSPIERDASEWTKWEKEAIDWR